MQITRRKEAMKDLTATFLLNNVKVTACTNIEGFTLEPVPKYPNNTYLRFDFTHEPKKDPYFEAEREIQLFSFVLSVLYKIKHPKLETINDKLNVGTKVTAPTIGPKQVDLEEVERAYKKVRSMNCKNRRIFEFVAGWVQKASGSRNVYDQFISYWIAFNFLYGRMPVEGERNKIEEWVKEYCKDPYASVFFADFQQNKCKSSECKAIKDLANAKLELKRRNKPPMRVSSELSKKTCNSEFDLEALRYLVLCIYGVRNNLFHGNWFYLNETRKHVGGAEFLLYKLIRQGLKEQCNFTF